MQLWDWTFLKLLLMIVSMMKFEHYYCGFFVKFLLLCTTAAKSGIFVPVQHARSVENYNYLIGQADAKGRQITVIKLPLPPPLHYTEEETAGVKQVHLHSFS